MNTSFPPEIPNKPKEISPSSPVTPTSKRSPKMLKQIQDLEAHLEMKTPNMQTPNQKIVARATQSVPNKEAQRIKQVSQILKPPVTEDVRILKKIKELKVKRDSLAELLDKKLKEEDLLKAKPLNKKKISTKAVVASSIKKLIEKFDSQEEISLEMLQPKYSITKNRPHLSKKLLNFATYFLTKDSLIKKIEQLDTQINKLEAKYLAIKKKTEIPKFFIPRKNQKPAIKDEGFKRLAKWQNSWRIKIVPNFVIEKALREIPELLKKGFNKFINSEGKEENLLELFKTLLNTKVAKKMMKDRVTVSLLCSSLLSIMSKNLGAFSEKKLWIEDVDFFNLNKVFRKKMENIQKASKKDSAPFDDMLEFMRDTLIDQVIKSYKASDGFSSNNSKAQG